MHRYLLHNDDVRDASEKLVSPGQVGLVNGWGVFSTLRVSRGVLFEYERHFARMSRDAALLRVPFPSDPEWLRSRLLKLVEANAAQDSTLRVIVVRNKGGAWEGPGINREFDVVAFTTALKDWGNGVRLGVVPNARHAASPFAGTKMLSWSFNLTWFEEAHEKGFDEVVLMNERDEVSECTSANIFIAQGDRVWTPPLSSGCLPGITRELLLGAIKVPGVDIGERVLRLADLEAADEVFITSSTRDMLAVNEIAGLRIRTADKVRPRLQAAFTAHIDQYVQSRLAKPVGTRA